MSFPPLEQRTELQSFTARVDRCRSKEVAAAEKEADLLKREEEVRRRELTVNAREEWMQKKEGEFRSAQRVAEHARYEFMLLLEFFFDSNLLFLILFAAMVQLLHLQDRNLTRHPTHFLFLMVICIYVWFYCLFLRHFVTYKFFSLSTSVFFLLFFGYGLLTLPSDAQVALRSHSTHRPILHKVAAVAAAPCLLAEN